MANQLNHDDLIASIKRSISVPDNQARYSDADFIAFANEEIQMTILPEILRLREDYLVYREDVTIVADQGSYQIPRRAVGRGLRDLYFFPDSSNTDKQNLPLISMQDDHLYTSVGDPTGYRLEGDKIVLMPTPDAAGGKLEVAFLLSPSQVTPITQSYQITNINTVSGVITVASTIDATLASTQIFDFVSNREASVPIKLSVDPTSFGGTTLTFAAADLPTELAVGDYVTLEGDSPFISLPQEVHQVVSAAVACRVLEGIGDYEALKYADERRNRAMRAMKEALAPRNIGENKKIIDRNGLLKGRHQRNFRRLS